MNAKELIENIMEYYQVHTLSDLSKKMGIGQPAISKWKSNNSINTIKKKCRELGIYNEIFGDINTQTIINNNGQAAQKVDGDQKFAVLFYICTSLLLCLLRTLCEPKQF